VRFEQLMTERNNMIRKHPNTKFILAHFGWRQRPGARRQAARRQLERLLRRRRGVYDFGRQPRAAQFLKCRIASCSGRTATSRTVSGYWRVFETSDEYFDYYRDYHVLEALWHRALGRRVSLQWKRVRLTPGLARTVAAD
jgi:hypothetical protein